MDRDEHPQHNEIRPAVRLSIARAASARACAPITTDNDLPAVHRTWVPELSLHDILRESTRDANCVGKIYVDAKVNFRSNVHRRCGLRCIPTRVQDMRCHEHDVIVIELY